MTDALGQQWPSRAASPAERDGRSTLERYAIARLRADVGAMPASDVVQLILWPDTVAAWARVANVAHAVAYNMLSRFKPYRRVRELLTHRLDVPTFVLDHLIDAPRPLPLAQRIDAAVDTVPDVAAAAGAEATPPPAPGPISPTERLPSVRDGSNPLERRAVWHVWHEIAALPGSIVVQLALYPETLAAWARRRTVPASMLYATLAGTHHYPALRDALARRLDVPTATLAALLDAPRREPSIPRPAPLADSPASRGQGRGAGDEPEPPPTDHRGLPDGMDGDDGQLSLGV